MIEQFRGNIHWKLGFYNFNIDIQRIIEELFTENSAVVGLEGGGQQLGGDTAVNWGVEINECAAEVQRWRRGRVGNV